MGRGGGEGNGDGGSGRGFGAVPILLLDMDEATVMGGPVWEGAGPIEGDGPRLASPEAGSVGVTLLRFIPLLATPSLLLAPPYLWPVPQLQVCLFLSLSTIHHMRVCLCFGSLLLCSECK